LEEESQGFNCLYAACSMGHVGNIRMLVFDFGFDINDAKEYKPM